MNDQLTFNTEPRSRAQDPPTSRQAPSNQASSELAQRILDMFHRYWSLTDDDLCELLPDMHGPTVRTCRSRLKNNGLLVPSGATRKSTRGRDMIVWTVAS